MTGLAPQALLFDLGGVVIDIDFDRALRAWQVYSRLSLDEIRQRFRFDAQYEQFERGQMDAKAYMDHLASILELQATHAQVLAAWNSIFVGEIADTVEAIGALPSHLPCYAFSNTNAAHHTVWSARYAAPLQSFRRVFCSHEMGLRKPERQAFDQVVRSIGVAPSAIMFFDDLQANVEGARAAGLQAVHVGSPADVRRAMRGWA